MSEKTPSDDQGTVLVVGSGDQRYREYLLRSAAARAPVWLLDAAEPTWQWEYASGASVVPFLDPTRFTPDIDGLVRAAAEVARQRRVVGVLTWDEQLVMATARVAERLGLPGLSVDGADRCRNKHRSREALTAAGLPQPRFALVTDRAEAHAAAADIGFPVVLKPRGMGASMGVVAVAGPEELDAAFAVADCSTGGPPAYRGGVLVEEMLVGPEISVDGAVADGRYTPLFVAHKQIGLEPYFEEYGHIVDAADPLLADGALLDVLSRAHTALGVRDGITHTEVKLTAAGPAIVEVNGRLGGDLIPYLGMLATGIDPAAVAVDVAAGRAPRPDRTRRTTAGIRFSYPPRSGRVEEIRLPAPGSCPDLVEAAPMVRAGDTVLLPPDGYVNRFGYVICESPLGTAACAAALDAASARSSVVMAEPLAA